MRTLGATVLTVLFLCVPATAQTYDVSDDRGGQIGTYIQTYAMLRAQGRPVVIHDDCLSACTLALGMIPRKNLTVLPTARLGFHAAWMPDDTGHPVTSREGTQVLWELYPAAIRGWIRLHGGLTRKMIYMTGREYNRLYARANAHASVDKRSKHRLKTANARQ